MNSAFCTNCNKQVNYELRYEPVLYFKDKEVNAERIIPFCSECGNDIFIKEIDNENLLRLCSKYKELAHFLTSKEISDFRERYKISQSELSNILGFRKMTINRYENGVIQSQAHDDILRSIIDDDAFFKKKVIEAFTKKKITEKTYNKIILNIKYDIQNDELDDLYLLYDHEPSIYNGFTKLNFDKIKNLILYVSSRIDLYKTKLNKIFWYIDFFYFKDNSKSITGLRYIKQQYGPAIELKGYDKFTSYLEKYDIIHIEETKNNYAIIKPKIAFDLAVFSEDELNVIDEVILRLKNLSTKELSKLYYMEVAWINTQEYELISYMHAYNLKLDL